MTTLFRKATKEQLKGRVALCGPTGSGKTWTALGWAVELAAGGKIALIDTERRSASLYAPHFEFDKLDWAPPFDPNKLIDTIRSAEAEGYAVLIIDSLTHFWTGEGGTLDVVEKAGQRAQGNRFAGWMTGTPLQRNMVDAILAANMHVIVTMRSKMEYLTEKDEKTGKNRVVKLGMAPEQRAGVEYEFTVIGDLDTEHRIFFTKSRCDLLADQVIQPGRQRDAAKVFAEWLEDGEPLATLEDKGKITAAMKAIADDGARERAKAHLLAEYGPAQTLKAADVEGALAFLASVASAATAAPPTIVGPVHVEATASDDDDDAARYYGETGIDTFEQPRLVAVEGEAICAQLYAQLDAEGQQKVESFMAARDFTWDAYEPKVLEPYVRSVAALARAAQ